MPVKPSKKLSWMLGQGLPTVVEPPLGKKMAGWGADERPPAEYHNWMFQIISEWIDYIDSFTLHVNKSEVPTVGADRSIWNLTETPVDDDSIWFIADGACYGKNDWTRVGKIITLNDGPLDVGVVPFVIYSMAQGMGGGAGSIFLPLYYTLSAGEIAAKEITLPVTPSDPESTIMDVIKGAAQEYDVDYRVVGNKLTWSGLGLEPDLVAGDKLRVIITS